MYASMYTNHVQAPTITPIDPATNSYSWCVVIALDSLKIYLTPDDIAKLVNCALGSKP